MRAALLLVSLALVAGCRKKTAPAPVIPTQPAPTTGSSDRHETAPTPENGDDMPTPVPTAATFGPIYFAYDSDALEPGARDELARLGQWLAAHPAARVQAAGHTDERGTVEYNIALGERRAGSVKDYLARLGVAATRVTTISYGEERPAVAGDDEASWGKNRRCELQLAER